MQDAIITNKRFGMLGMALAISSILLSILSGNILLAFLSSLFASLSILFWKYGYIIIPIVIERLNVIEFMSEYEIPPSQDVIVKKINNIFYASSFLSAKITDSITEKSNPEK
ncbi:hypothetical protein HY570_03920, partial [Candidatus Micrarchaeota archaeon]|nr:hypothetical protein [Candidatus Micrarchaeota archaeon]